MKEPGYQRSGDGALLTAQLNEFIKKLASYSALELNQLYIKIKGNNCLQIHPDLIPVCTWEVVRKITDPGMLFYMINNGHIQDFTTALQTNNINLSHLRHTERVEILRKALELDVSAAVVYIMHPTARMHEIAPFLVHYSQAQSIIQTALNNSKLVTPMDLGAFNMMARLDIMLILGAAYINQYREISPVPTNRKYNQTELLALDKIRENMYDITKLNPEEQNRLLSACRKFTKAENLVLEEFSKYTLKKDPITTLRLDEADDERMPFVESVRSRGRNGGCTLF